MILTEIVEVAFEGWISYLLIIWRRSSLWLILTCLSAVNPHPEWPLVMVSIVRIRSQQLDYEYFMCKYTHETKDRTEPFLKVLDLHYFWMCWRLRSMRLQFHIRLVSLRKKVIKITTVRSLEHPSIKESWRDKRLTSRACIGKSRSLTDQHRLVDIVCGIHLIP